MPTSFTSTDSQVCMWFNKLISSLVGDQIEIESGIANKEKKDFYGAAMNSDYYSLSSNVRLQSTQFFISSMLKDYIEEIKKRNAQPLSLSLKLSNSKILAWAITKDDDEETENKLYLAAAAINAKYYKEGFYISTTIVEESDNYNAPAQYQLLFSNGQL